MIIGNVVEIAGGPCVGHGIARAAPGAFGALPALGERRMDRDGGAQSGGRLVPLARRESRSGHPSGRLVGQNGHRRRFERNGRTSGKQPNLNDYKFGDIICILNPYLYLSIFLEDERHTTIQT